jgi:hypothetical protein
MATLVFNAIGTAIGGPLGGAIGASFGQQIDRAALGGPPRQGPRLKELDVQLSSYGIQIPAIFGAMRVAGTVIWATDLIESEGTSGGGKSGPATIQYSYSANFAVALSSRPVARIGRIWADGKLLRGAAGDFKTETLFRFYDGHGDQALDPLIASDTAAGLCPAHRGLAYVVFEGLQLADFGNRIPQLTFEVFEREGPVPLADIARSISGSIIDGAVNQSIDGYAASGADARVAVAPLLSAYPLFTQAEGDRIKLYAKDASAITVSADDPVSAVQNRKIASPASKRADSRKSATSLSLRHYDPARDYQSGVQTAGIASALGGDLVVELPAAIGASGARNMAQNLWLSDQVGAVNGTLSIPLAQHAVTLGSAITADGSRIIEIEHGHGYSTVKTQNWPEAPIALAGSADSGAHLAESDVLAGETILRLIDLPPLPGQANNKPILAIAAAGTGAGWRRAMLSAVADNGELTELGRTARAACLGTTVSILPPHPAHLLDADNVIIVDLPDGAAACPPGSGSALDAAAPLLCLNGEFIHYGSAQQIDPRRFRISGLLRGVFGSKSGQSHAIGAPCVFLDRASLILPDIPGLSIGTTASVEAMGIGDAEPVAATLEINGRAILPLSPVHGRVEKPAAGGLRIFWIRRTRSDAGWQDYVDVPLGEEELRFEVRIIGPAGEFALYEASDFGLEITAAQLAGWGVASGTALSATVRQIGDFARSPWHDISFVI